jgi:hypothetical protein
MRRLATAVLAAQQERAQRTGVITIVSEDAMREPPHFFYYYCVLANQREFSIDVQDPDAGGQPPAMGQHQSGVWMARAPAQRVYQQRRCCRAARTSGGWASGVYEGTMQSTGTLNVNTTAGVMTAAV